MEINVIPRPPRLAPTFGSLKDGDVFISIATGTAYMKVEPVHAKGGEIINAVRLKEGDSASFADDYVVRVVKSARVQIEE